MNDLPANDRGPRQKDGTPTASRVLADGTMVELVCDSEARTTAFAIWRDDAWTIEAEIEDGFGNRLIPFSPNNNLIKNDVVLLLSEPEEYGTEEALVSEIRAFIHRYVDVRPVSLLLSTTVIVFPSGETVILATSVTVPSRLSVSSMV